ncbi:MAG: uroporphyrinogen-III C-methyltransferase [Candidatus Nitrosothermus koennekii]|nr:MAG: uroporphyrinogen-III C-methyltransferase [Candidatus Nitrosothermus koennekii]
MNEGIVYIVGAGPGDPELISIKAINIMKDADVILYDRLVSKELLDKFDVEKIYVGRAVGDDYKHQEQTNQLMLKYAKEGKKVVRLHGGDPFIFGRGGEEAEFLKENNIRFEIIPGISSIIAASASSLVPLTDRRYASSLAIVTGHEDPMKEYERVRWEMLPKAVDTIVVLMGISNLEKIIDRLVDGGMDKDTRIAVIENASKKEERIIYGKLDDIVMKVKEQKIKPPAVIIIGDVVKVSERLRA